MFYFEDDKLTDVIICCGANIKRNFADAPFPGKMTDEARGDMCERILTALDDRNAIYDSDDVEEDMLLDARDLMEDVCFAGRDEEDDGDLKIVLGPGEKAIITVNRRDHLNISSYVSGNDPLDALQIVRGAESLLSEAGIYAFDPDFGYLTASPSDTGSGARAMFLMHLQGLGRLEKIDEVKDELREKGLSLRPVMAPDGEDAAEFYCLVSRITMGKSAEDVFRETRETAIELALREREARDELIIEDTDAFADNVVRALGILVNARLMYYIELISLYGDVRAGLTGGLLDGNLTEFDDFIERMSPYRLTQDHGKMTDREDELLRADLSREKFAKYIRINKI